MILTSIYFFIIGTAVGSFLNVLIDRLPEGKPITGRSRCDHCGRQLAWWELIPIYSYLIQNGRSRCCKRKLSLQYPLVEIITGIFFVLIFNFQFLIFNENLKFKILNLTILLGIISCLIVIFMTDCKKQIIPDSIQIALLIFAIIFNFQFLIFNENLNLQILNWFLSGFAVMSPIFLLWLVTRGQGMGFGDVKLAAIMGVLLGTKGGLVALYLAFISGALVGLVLLIMGQKKLKSKIAFGPFLVLGIMTVLFLEKPLFGLIRQIYHL